MHFRLNFRLALVASVFALLVAIPLTLVWAQSQGSSTPPVGYPTLSDMSDFVKVSVNGVPMSDWVADQAPEFESVLPYTADIKVEIDWVKADQYIQRIEVPRKNGVLKPLLQGYKSNYFFKVSFGDGEDLNPKNCKNIKDTFKYKDTICNQPLVAVSLRRNFRVSPVPPTNTTITHTYVYDKDFPIQFSLMAVPRGERTADAVPVAQLGQTIVRVNVPEVSVTATNISAAAGQERSLSLSCPAMFDFAYIEVTGDRDSIDSPLLTRSGNKYFIIDALTPVTSGASSTGSGGSPFVGDDNSTSTVSAVGITSLDLKLTPTRDTTIDVFCRPWGLTEDAFKKYVKYQRYFTYQIPAVPYINKSVTYIINGDDPEPPTPPTDPDDPVTVCEEVRECRVNQFGQDYVLVSDAGDVCGATYEQVCLNGCLNGACLPSDQCIPAPVCSEGSNSVYNSCTGELIERCEVSCNQGVCTNQPGGDPMVAVANLVANPGIVVKGGTTRITWEIENADNCEINGDNGDSWTTLVGDYDSSPLEQTTDYTLVCTDFDGGTIEQSVTVRIAPTWQEL